ncbi:MAG: threonine--tRNA ligase [Candidatus Krumholzibacteria bacterium]|nr:threonine--tRNA ligase [Candidatus Krumholzibacteria bacterium]
MVHITLPDGKEKSFADSEVAVRDVVSSLGDSWTRNAVAAEYGGRVVDLHQNISGDGAFRVLTQSDDVGLRTLRHTASHVLALAVQELFPGVKFAIGPAIAEGFYYDFDVETPFTPEDLERIEAKMHEILKAKPEIHREVWDKDKARRYFSGKNQPYKLELIDDIEDEHVSIYVLGAFTDLCAGPHLPDARRIKSFKVLNSAGAYWRGDSSKTMLQRIYATAFFKKKDLDEHLARRAEAEKRDHRKLGKTLDLFEVRDEAGGGLVFWYPKGAVIRDVVERYLKHEYKERGYELVFTPHIAKADLWRTSGHFDYYADNMYTMDVEAQQYVLKPMNCPGHILVFKRRLYSYRDLPIRVAEMGTVYRRELSGTLHGMLRVRGFTQDDAHLFCAPEQVSEEVDKELSFAIDVLTACGFKDFSVELSVRDPNDEEKYAGLPQEWDHAERALEEAVQRRGLEYKRMEGEAVFYGPKIDVKVIDAIGRPWQLSTIQFDFNLPKRFDITYVAKGGDRKEVVMVHRALLGSIERFVGILTEHFAGAFPLWLAPVQVVVLPISSEDPTYAEKVRHQLHEAGMRVELDARDEKIGYRIRDAEVHKIPYMLVVGKREAEASTVAVRARSQGDLGSRKVDDFIAEMVDEVSSRR